MVLQAVGALPEDALAAAAEFHARDLPQLESLAGEDLLLVFPPADHSHRAWRLAVLQSLARRFAPLRVNGVASDDQAAVSSAAKFLAKAPGVTGQYLPLDAEGAQGAL